MKKRPSSGIWPSSSWRLLLARASGLLAGAGCKDWAFGGGSALAFRLGHRTSYDADIFLADAQDLGRLTPRFNPVAEALAQSYTEQGSSLEIVTVLGDIAFTVSRDLTAQPAVVERIGDVETPCHSNAEILAKAIEFRGFAFALGDMFDLAVLIDRDPRSVEIALAACSQGAIDQARARIDTERDGLAKALPDFVNPTPLGRLYIAKAAGILAGYFDGRR
jgi:hypothetical protein